MDYYVKVSPELLESMTLAAIESFYYGDGMEKPENEITEVSKEILGHIWGYRKVEAHRTVFFLDRMSLSISSTRMPDSVHDLNNRAARLKKSVVELFSPELTLLGDFHTHPHPKKSESIVKKDKLYRFSPEDFGSFVSDDLIWESAGNNPVMLVITVCKRRKMATDAMTHISRNTATYPIGQLRFWISAVVGFAHIGKRSRIGKRMHTMNKSAKVELIIDNYIQSLEGEQFETD
jgi:hypothetical protein